MEIKNSFGLTKVKHVIAVSSCKGGVGKSTVAAGFARSLCQQGFKTGLLDADIHGPSLPTLFNLTSGVKVLSNEFRMIVPVESQGLKLMSFGFLLGDAPAVMRGPIVTRYIQQMMLQTDWGELDYLIVDMPPGTGDVQLTITQSARLTGAVIVTTRQTLSLVDVARGILMFEKVSVPILGIVDNMAYFVCGSCQTKHYLFGGEHALEKRFGVKTLVEIPLIADLALESYMDQGAQAMLDAVKAQAQAKEQLPEVSFDAEHIHLKFADGRQVQVKNRDLRLNCMCALCVSELTGQKLIAPAKIRPDIAPKEIVPLGNYALSITWNDGHSSGIYPYSMFELWGHNT
ncbi:MAG: P-loop NTPase [Candidatus Omnitrophota bacterium]|nr:P-loop NTPase [Candidatus Omnitrophota bacterium]